MKLGTYQIAILERLNDSLGGGYLTRDIAKRIPHFGHNSRTQSGATRSWLVELERDGLVKRLDDDKPTVWAITDAGRTAINSPKQQFTADREGEVMNFKAVLDSLDAAAREIERKRVQEVIAQAVEQSAFCYSGSSATKIVPSASGEAATHVVAAYIRALDLSDPNQQGRDASK